jgi:hypothetical protein
MSDFDNIINDRLNEDEGMEHFPRREANWAKMANRLAQFEAENPLPNQVVAPTTGVSLAWRRFVWLSAAATLVGIASLLIWQFREVDKIKQENVQLRHEVDRLKQPDSQSALPPFDATAVVKNEMSFKPNSNPIEAQTQPSDRPASISQMTHTPIKTPAPSGGVLSATREPYGQKDPLSQAVSVDNLKKKTTKPVDNQLLVPFAQKQIGNEINFDKTGKEANSPLEASKSKSAMGSKKEQIAQTESKDLVPKPEPLVKPNEPLAEQKTETQWTTADKPSDKKTESAVVVATTEEVKTESQADVAVNSPQNTGSKPLEGEEGKTETTAGKTEAAAAQNTEAAKTPIIPTDKGKSLKWKNLGVSIGVNGVSNHFLPRLRGVENSRGFGLAAQMNLTKQFSLTVNADFLTTEFELRNTPNAGHLPRGAGRPKDWRDTSRRPPRPNFDLNKAQCENQSRFVSVGLRYTLPIKTMIQPSIFIGHTWRKTEEFDIRFQFKDPISDEIATTVEVVPTERIANIWQLGLAFEKSLKRFTFGLSAEYQKDFSGVTLPNGQNIVADAAILRGGIKYRIF